jgi:hypothetical protein
MNEENLSNIDPTAEAEEEKARRLSELQEIPRRLRHLLLPKDRMLLQEAEAKPPKKQPVTYFTGDPLTRPNFSGYLPKYEPPTVEAIDPSEFVEHVTKKGNSTLATQGAEEVNRLMRTVAEAREIKKTGGQQSK